MRKCMLASSVSFAIALGAWTPVYAQQAAEHTEVSHSLQEIVVTAQRRAENLQSVPIAITAVNADLLAAARVDNIANVQAISPSVGFRSAYIASSSANLIVRGLGTTGASRNFEGSVGVFIDGVYRTRAASALQNFLDIDGLQLLRGPQGTLFGKNTTAGAVLLNSAKPSLDRAEGLVEVNYGNYESIVARAAASIPVGDNAAFRIAGLASKRDGFYTDTTTGADLNGDSTQAVKAQFLVEPTDQLALRLIGDYSHSYGHCCYATADFINGPTQPLINALTVLAGRTLPSTRRGDFAQTLNYNGTQEIEDFGGTLLIDADIGGGKLKSVTALRKFTLDQRDNDADFTGADLLLYTETFASRFFSQELTYSFDIDALNGDAIFGAFFSDEKLQFGRDFSHGTQAQRYWDTILSVPPFSLRPGTVRAVGRNAQEEMRGSARSYAGFAHFNFAVGSKVNVIAGIRYSIEEKQGSFRNSFYNPAPNNVYRILGVGPSPDYDRSKTDRSLSGTFGVQYKPVADVMLYATYNRGFKAGGITIDSAAAGGVAQNPAVTPGAIPGDPSYAPETIDAFEVGMKAQYLDRRARTNIALFHYDIRNVQIAQFRGLQFAVVSAKSATDYGLEIENLFRLSDSLNLAIDGTWIPHAKFGVDPTIGVISGSRFRYAPKLAGNVALNLDAPVTGKMNVTARAQYQYTSSQLLNTANTSQQGPVSLVNANLGLKWPDSNVELEGWVQNVFDKTYVQLAYESPLQRGDQNAYLGAPRTYGIRMRAKF